MSQSFSVLFKTCQSTSGENQLYTRDIQNFSKHGYFMVLAKQKCCQASRKLLLKLLINQLPQHMTRDVVVLPKLLAKYYNLIDGDLIDLLPIERPPMAKIAVLHSRYEVDIDSNDLRGQTVNEGNLIKLKNRPHFVQYVSPAQNCVLTSDTKMITLKSLNYFSLLNVEKLFVIVNVLYFLMPILIRHSRRCLKILFSKCRQVKVIDNVCACTKDAAVDHCIIVSFCQSKLLNVQDGNFYNIYSKNRKICRMVECKIVKPCCRLCKLNSYITNIGYVLLKPALQLNMHKLNEVLFGENVSDPPMYGLFLFKIYDMKI